MCDVDLVLHALAAYPAAIPLAEFPGAIGEPADVAAEVLGELLTAELIEASTAATGPVLTLTSRAAACLAEGHQTVRYGLHRELPVSRTDARAIRAVHQASWRERAHWESRHRTCTDLELDPERRHEIRWDPRPGDPRLILGVGFVSWSPAVEGMAPCPVCQDARLEPLVFCLGCCRVGIEPPPVPVPDASRPRSRKERRADLGGGVGPAKVKPDRARAAAGWFAEIDDHRRKKRKPAPAPPRVQ